MSAFLKPVGPIDVSDLPDYPISANDRLDAHYFLQWNLKRWRGSTFRKTCDPEVGWYGFQLFCIAHDGTPVGTLSCDETELAFDLNLSLEQWQVLMRRKVTPLCGWYRVQCDNGEVRLAHKVVTEVALEALKSKRRNAAKNADDRQRKRFGTIAGHLRQLPGGDRFASNDDQLAAISDWIEAAYPNGSATKNRVIEALNDLNSRA